MVGEVGGQTPWLAGWAGWLAELVGWPESYQHQAQALPESLQSWTGWQSWLARQKAPSPGPSLTLFSKEY